MSNKILVVVDMQNDFIDGVLGTNAALVIVPKVKNLIENFDGRGIFYTLDTHEMPFYTSSIEGQRIPFHCPYCEEGWFINDEIADALQFFEGLNEDNFIEAIEKDTFGSDCELVAAITQRFMNDALDEIVICGLCTDICVISNALILRAAFPKIKISVVADCCAGSTKENHIAALNIMKANCIDVVGN